MFNGPVPDITTDTLMAVVDNGIETGITAISDCWGAYLDLDGEGYTHRTVRLRPACQRPASTRFRARAGDWRFCVLRDSDLLVAK